MIVPQAENFGRGAHRGVIGELHDLALTEVVSTTVGAELHHLVFKAREAIKRAHFVQALVKRGDVSVMTEVGAVFATLRPLGRDAEGVAHAAARAFGANLHAEIGQIVAGLKPGREPGDGTIVFWHRGFAVSDVVLGNWIYERAERENVGTLFPLLEAGEE